MSEEKIMLFEVYETISVGRGPVGLEPIFREIDNMNLKEAVRQLWRQICDIDKEGADDCYAHEGDIVVRLSKDSEIDGWIPSVFEGYRVRKSYYQTTTESKK
jgi:hypothetical protein